MRPSASEALDTLVCLVVSDVHDDLAAVSALHEWLHACKQNVDVVLYPGDFTTAPHPRKPDEATQPPDESHYEAKAQQILTALSALGSSLYFVPGNHDPLVHFNATAIARTGAVQNTHGKALPLAPGLWIVGFGILGFGI